MGKKKVKEVCTEKNCNKCNKDCPEEEGGEA